MYCTSISSAGSQYKWGQIVKQGESRTQGESGKQGKSEKEGESEKEDTPEMTTIKVERDWMPIHRCDVKVKVKEYNKVKVES
jgi:hypothetical protein